jgi:hypothetical protein
MNYQNSKVTLYCSSLEGRRWLGGQTPSCPQSTPYCSPSPLTLPSPNPPPQIAPNYSRCIFPDSRAFFAAWRSNSVAVNLAFILAACSATILSSPLRVDIPTKGSFSQAEQKVGSSISSKQPRSSTSSRLRFCPLR